MAKTDQLNNSDSGKYVLVPTDEGLDAELALSPQAPKPRLYSLLLYKISTGLFFMAWAAMLLDFVPFLMLRQVGILTCYAFRTLGYGVWRLYIRSHFDDTDVIQNLIRERLKNKEASGDLDFEKDFASWQAWRIFVREHFSEYDFVDNLEFEGEHRVTRAVFQREKHAAWLGIFSCVSFLVYLTMTLVCPPIAAVALIVGLWSLVTSNVVWAKGCQDHLINSNSGNDMELTTVGAGTDQANQLAVLRERGHQSYRNYAFMLTFTSLLVAVGLTLSVFCPPVAAFLGLAIIGSFTVNTVAGFSFGAVAVGFFFKSYLIKREYKALQLELESEKSQLELTDSSVPPATLVK